MLTYSAVVKQVEQRYEKSPSVLSVSTDHGVKVRAESRVFVVMAETSNHSSFGSSNSLLHQVWHFQTSNSLHLNESSKTSTFRFWQQAVKLNRIAITNTYVDKTWIFLVNLHQLVVCLVFHSWLWVSSHSNQVWHTLKFKNVLKSKSSNFLTTSYLRMKKSVNTCTGCMSPWPRVSVITFRA